MSYSVYACLTDAKKVSSIYGAKNQNLIGELSAAIKSELDNLDDYFADTLSPQQNAFEVLKDIVDGRISFPEIPFMYGYVYEKICEYFGVQIFNAEYLWELEEQSAFIPIPFSPDFPHIISIEKAQLKEKKEKFLALQVGSGIGDCDYEEEINDLTYIFDEAIEQYKDLIICTY